MLQHPNVVVLGGGFGGLEAIFYLRQRLGRRARLTLVSDRDTFAFKPNTIYIPFGKDPQRYVVPLTQALTRRQIEFVQATVTDIAPGPQLVKTDSGEIPYDILVVATGAGMRREEVPGLEQHGNTIWTPEDMLVLRRDLEGLVELGEGDAKRRVLFAVPAGNKCSGPLYEIALMLDTWLRRKGARDRVDIAYTTHEATYLQAFGPRLHDVVVKEFAERGIEGHRNVAVQEVDAAAVTYDDARLAYDVLVAFPPYVSAVKYPELPSDDRGFLLTDPVSRQVKDHPDVYAVGDAGDFPVKQAFLALLQADTAGEHIAQRILGEQPDAAFDPVSMCIMEQFDKATFAQVPLRTTGDPNAPVAVREDANDLYRVGSGQIWRVGKKMLGMVLPHRFRIGRPFHAGATWSMMEAGLKVMSGAFAD